MTNAPQPESMSTMAQRITAQPDLPFCLPGLAVVVHRNGRNGERAFAGTDAQGTPVRDDTLFPLTSSSKLALGLVVLQLVDEGVIGLDDPIGRFVPRAEAARAGATVRSLLSHTSGLPLDLDAALTPYTRHLDWAALAAGCIGTVPTREPGTCVQYSNVGYGLLAIAAETLTETPIVTLLEKRVFTPLGIEAYIGRLPPRKPAVVDQIDSEYVGTELEPYNSEFWQQLGIPWAGIYSTADGLLALVRAYESDAHHPLVRAETSALARTNQVGDLGGGFTKPDPFLGFNKSRSITWPRCAWGLTLELHGDKRPHWAPASAPPDSFGHIGVSGCIGWVDPSRGVAWAALGTRSTDNGWVLRHGASIGTIACSNTAQD